MAMPNKKGWLAVLFILACLAIPFGITYYVSTNTFKAKFSRFQGVEPKVPENASLENSRILDDRVTLVRGERIRIENTSLVFRGTEDGQVMLDLFLEDLDPARAYPQSFSAKVAPDQVLRLGDVGYTVTAVSKNTLILKIYRRMGAD